jgi:hypothetical protein
MNKKRELLLLVYDKKGGQSQTSLNLNRGSSLAMPSSGASPSPSLNS